MKALRFIFGGHPGHLDQLDHQDLRDLKEIPDTRELKETLAIMELKEVMDTLEPLEIQVIPEIREKLAEQVQMGHLENGEGLVRQDMTAKMVQVAKMDIREQQDQRVIMENQDMMATMGRKGNEDRPDIKEIKVKWEIVYKGNS